MFSNPTVLLRGIKCAFFSSPLFDPHKTLQTGAGIAIAFRNEDTQVL